MEFKQEKVEYKVSQKEYYLKTKFQKQNSETRYWGNGIMLMRIHSNRNRYRLAGDRQTGQVYCSSNHVAMHCRWNTWPQGNSRVAAPFFRVTIHIAQISSGSGEGLGISALPLVPGLGTEGWAGLRPVPLTPPEVLGRRL